MPRAGLTPSRVVAEAAAVADQVGLERLTLAAVAERFGVALPSLYKHVDGLDGLRRGLAVLGVHELASALEAAAGGRTGRDALTALAAAYRGFARDHPGRYAATLRAPSSDDVEHLAASDRVLGIVSAAMGGYGLDDDDLVHAIRGLRAALHGFVALEAAGGFGLPQSVDESFDQLIDALHRAYAPPPP